jgi:hypothetical protein
LELLPRTIPLKAVAEQPPANPVIFGAGKARDELSIEVELHAYLPHDIYDVNDSR